MAGPKQRSRRLPTGLLLFLLSLTLFFLIWDFPRLLTPIPPYEPEAFSARMLKGGLSIGYKVGYVGTLLLVAAQLYSVRKRLEQKYLRRLGSGRRWLQIHCLTDLPAPTLVLIHSGFPYSFKYINPFNHIHLSWGWEGLTGVAGLAAWLLLISTLSGFFGRYLYRRLDRGMRRWFRYWRPVHIVLASSLYATGIIHLIVVVWFKFVSAV